MNDLAKRIVAMWSDPGSRPPFKRKLINNEGCCCAQGQALRCAGRSDDYLRELDQDDADLEVAKLLEISRAHSVLLRNINDRDNSCPQDVLSAPEKILGSEANRILAFWQQLDRRTTEQWRATMNATGDADGFAARMVARDVALAVAGSAARDAAWFAAKDATWPVSDVTVTASRLAAGATVEIQGHSLLSSLYFLPCFGIHSVEELDQ